MTFIFPYTGNNNPMWLIFFRGLKPPTSICKRLPEGSYSSTTIMEWDSRHSPTFCSDGGVKSFLFPLFVLLGSSVVFFTLPIVLACVLQWSRVYCYSHSILYSLSIYYTIIQWIYYKLFDLYNTVSSIIAKLLYSWSTILYYSTIILYIFEDMHPFMHPFTPIFIRIHPVPLRALQTMNHQAGRGREDTSGFFFVLMTQNIVEWC